VRPLLPVASVFIHHMRYVSSCWPPLHCPRLLATCQHAPSQDQLATTCPYKTSTQVAVHNTPQDCWVSFLGGVYNLTELVKVSRVYRIVAAVGQHPYARMHERVMALCKLVTQHT
jgi:hypothetical protein